MTTALIDVLLPAFAVILGGIGCFRARWLEERWRRDQSSEASTNPSIIAARVGGGLVFIGGLIALVSEVGDLLP